MLRIALIATDLVFVAFTLFRCVCGIFIVHSPFFFIVLSIYVWTACGQNGEMNGLINILGVLGAYPRVGKYNLGNVAYHCDCVLYELL